MRRPALALLALVLLVPGWSHADAAGAPKPQVSDRGGDSLATKSQDIKSVLFRAVGPANSRGLEVTLSTYSPIMQDLSTFNYEVQATTSCGDVSFSFSPGTPYEKVTGLNGWVSTDCGDVSDLVTAQVKDTTVTWVLPLDPKLFKRGTVFTDFEARIDVANPALPFPSSATATSLGLVDKATARGPWRLP